MTLSYTQHLHLAVPDFLSEPWHAEFAAAMDSIDNAVYQVLIAQNAALWVNSHVYTVGTLVISPDTGLLYSCAVANTSSASPTTFTQELVAHPTFWTSFAPSLATQAEAEAGIENTKYMSPLRVAQAIVVQAPTPSIASQAQAEAGTDNTKMMTPLRTAQSIAVRAALPPQGRLTLLTNTPVMITTQLLSANIFYTPYVGPLAPFYDGVSMSDENLWGELVTAASDTAKNPAAIGVSKMNDWFLWKDSAIVTMTIASPAVVSWTGHGMAAGQPFRFTTTGALPTNVNPDTTYFVIAGGLGANSFQFAATIGGAAINSSGSQSGVHTANTRRLGHGPDWTNDTTRSAGTNLTRISGIYLNTNAITNGPGALRGTYVGTTRSDGASSFSYIFGASGTGGVQGYLSVWNMYNRVNTVSTVSDNGVSYTYTSAATRQKRASTTAQNTFVSGLPEEPIHAHAVTRIALTGATPFVFAGVQLDSTTTFVGQPGFLALGNASVPHTYTFPPQTGYHVVSWNEGGDGTNANSFCVGSADYMQITVRN